MQLELRLMTAARASATVSAQRWRVLSPHLDHALGLPPHEREVWLAQLAQQDAGLAAELRTMLADHDAAGEDAFLDVPVTSPEGLDALDLRGTQLGPYLLESHVGQGGMASVWRARRTDGAHHAPAAVKIINSALYCPEAVECFLREGSILARLAHPHVVRLLDVGVGLSGLPYLAMEYVDGVRIDRYCDERKLGTAARLRLLLQATHALAYVHSQGVVHCDLKPQNLLVSQSGQIKLVDFGIAMLSDGQAGPLRGRIPTACGDPALTPQFAAPEQLTGGPVSEAADVYALGVLLYVLLTGRHPTGLHDASPAQYAHAILSSDAIKPSEAVAAWHAEAPEACARMAADRGTTPTALEMLLRGALDGIVLRALQHDPERRYRRVETLTEDLQRRLHPAASSVYH